MITPNRTQRALRILTLCLLGSLIGFGAPVSAQAQTDPNTFVVNSTLDQIDIDPGDGVCDADLGSEVRCTLRAAVMEANVLGGTQTIRLTDPTYKLTLKGANEDASRTGDLDITSNIHVVGDTATRPTIDASNLDDRVLHITGSLVSGVRLTGLTIRGGNAANSNGGGILADGRVSLQLQAVTVTGNRAFGAAGVNMDDGLLNITSSRIENNVSRSSIGGLASGADTTLINSTISGNHSDGNVGGLAVHGTNVNTNILRSAIINNTGLRLGGMEITGLGGLVSLTNVTISGNRALNGTFGTGGLFLDGSSTNGLALNNVTITRNAGVSVGGMAMNRLFMTANNTIIANNTGGDCRLPQGNIFGSHNITGDPSCSLIGSNNQRNTNPQLSPLALNGAGNGTLTHALLDTSPARDRGNNATCSDRDQRFFTRPQNGTCDIGAFELTKPAMIGTATLLPANLHATAGQTSTITLRWTVPPTMTWRDLRTVDFQLTHADTTPIIVRFSQGVTNTDSLDDTAAFATGSLGATTDTLTLFDNGSEAGTAVVGTPLIINGEQAALDMGQSRVETDGPSGQSITLTLAIAFKQPLAGRVYVATLAASDANGGLQDSTVGTVAVGPFRALLPLMAR